MSKLFLVIGTVGAGVVIKGLLLFHFIGVERLKTFSIKEWVGLITITGIGFVVLFFARRKFLQWSRK